MYLFPLMLTGIVRNRENIVQIPYAVSEIHIYLQPGYSFIIRRYRMLDYKGNLHDRPSLSAPTYKIVGL